MRCSFHKSNTATKCLFMAALIYFSFFLDLYGAILDLLLAIFCGAFFATTFLTVFFFTTFFAGAFFVTVFLVVVFLTFLFVVAVLVLAINLDLIRILGWKKYQKQTK